MRVADQPTFSRVAFTVLQISCELHELTEDSCGWPFVTLNNNQLTVTNTGLNILLLK